MAVELVRQWTDPNSMWASVTVSGVDFDDPFSGADMRRKDFSFSWQGEQLVGLHHYEREVGGALLRVFLQ